MAELRKRTPEEIAEMRERSIAQAKVIQKTHAACDKLPCDRLEYIRSSASEGCGEALLECNDPIELHAFVSNWNCDVGVEVLLEVAKHRACDAGTALWLYWENDPYFYSRYGTIEDAGSKEERVMFDCLLVIERRMASKDFATSLVPFDPHLWIETKYLDAAWGVRKIPECMFNAIDPARCGA